MNWLIYIGGFVLTSVCIIWILHHMDSEALMWLLIVGWLPTWIWICWKFIK